MNNIADGRLNEIFSPSITGPFIMGILNLTPDSFSDGGSYTDIGSIKLKIDEMVSHETDIIDIGGESTRPGAVPVDASTEWERIHLAIEYIISQHPGVLVSCDTYKAAVAEKALSKGVHIINDISGGTFDKDMLPLISQTEAGFVLMHTGGRPETMQDSPYYENVVDSVRYFFERQIDTCKKLGITKLLLDPGIGFGKSNEHNRLLLLKISDFSSLGFPVLVGISRKSMFAKLFDIPAEKRDVPTVILEALLFSAGTKIFRMHNTLYGKYLKDLCKYMAVE